MEPTLVSMIRYGDGEPMTADVHPDMVSDYQSGGWMLAEPMVTAEPVKDEKATAELPKPQRKPRSKADALK